DAREDGLLARVRRLELPGFPVDHGWGPGLHTLDDALAEQALGPEDEEDEGQRVGEPVLDGAAHQRPPVHLADLLAGADDEPAHDGARHRGEAAENQYGQRLQRDQGQAELYAALRAPHDAG